MTCASCVKSSAHDREEECEPHDLGDDGRQSGAEELESRSAEVAEDQDPVARELHDRDAGRDPHRRTHVPVGAQRAVENQRDRQDHRRPDDQVQIGDGGVDDGLLRAEHGQDGPRADDHDRDEHERDDCRYLD